MRRLIPVTLLGAVAGLSFQGAFEVGDIAVFCLIVALLQAGIAWGLLRLRATLARRSLPALPFAVLGAALGWLIFLPVIAQMMASGPKDPGTFLTILGDAVTDGPHRLLTTTPAAQPSAVLLTLLGSLVWWTTFWSATAALTESSSLLVALPPIILVAAGTAAAAGAGNPGALSVASGFVVLVVLFLWTDQGERERPAQSRARARDAFVSSAPALAGITAAALLAVALGPRLPGMSHREPWDPRKLLGSPAPVTTNADPLSQADEWLKSDSPAELFRVHTTDHTQPLRWVTLDAYDGRKWTSSADFRLAGKSLPKPDAEQLPPGPTTALSESLHVDHLPGPWLPAAGVVRSFGTDAALRVDPRLAALATGDGLDVAGLDYRVDSELPVLDDPTRLAAAPPGHGGTVEALRTLPAGMPTDVAEWSTGSVDGMDPYAQLQHLAQVVSTKFRYDSKAAPGQSYGRLNLLIQDAAKAAGANGDTGSGDPSTGPSSGATPSADPSTGAAAGPDSPVGTSPDLLATLFAVAAREAGFPTRIVVGFDPGTAVGADEYSVTGADVRIWPEAYFAGVGWVPFLDAIPATGSASTPGSAPVQAVPTGSATAAAPSSHAPAPNPSVSGPLPSVQFQQPTPTKHHVSSIAFVVGGLVAVVAGTVPLVLLALRRRARRLRRQDPDPRRRTLWAWEDALTALASSGRVGRSARAATLREWRSWTPREIAAAAPGRIGAAGSGASVRSNSLPTAESAAAESVTAESGGVASVQRLASLSEAAVYAPDPPYPHEADEAWACADTIRTLAKRRH
jgi:hypothetical protein